MDPSRFDRLVRSLAHPASRRAALATLLGGALAGVTQAADAANCPAGKKRCHGHCIPKHRQCHQPGSGCADNGQSCQQDGQCCSTHCANGVCAPQLGCLADNALCSQDSDCCSANCFNFACADRVASCSAGGTTKPCRPPAKGCAGAQCCNGALSCNDGCCQGTANQCNPAGNCCAPNCNGRPCGDDGCGNGETCGTCPTGQTCNATTGQCVPHCTPNCTGKACGDDGCGGSCGPCQTGQTCQNGTCCTPNCTGKTCGDDGCGGQCGDCPADRLRFCVNDICCNLNVVNDNACSATMPCCGTHQCRNGGCCFADGTGPCYTGADDACCSRCIPADPNCTGRCPGTCATTG